MRSARGSTGRCTGWPNPGTLPPASWMPRASSSGSSSDSSSRAHSPDVPRITGPAPRSPAATAPCSAAGSAASVIRAATFDGMSPCSAIATRTRSRKKRCGSVGSSPVSSTWKYSVNVRRPITSPTRSRPRTSTRSADAFAMCVLRSPGTGDQRLELANGQLARQVLHAAIRSGDEAFARHNLERPPNALGDFVCRFRLVRTEVQDSEHDRLVRQVAQDPGVELWLRGLDRDMRRRARVQLREERVAGHSFLVLHNVCIAEARVEDGGPADAVERAVDGVGRARARWLRRRLEVGLIDLHDVRAGCFEMAELVVDRVRIAERKAALVVVVVVLRLLRHRERARNGDLDPAVRDRAKELDVAHLDSSGAADRADDARHRILVTGAVERHAGSLQINSLERRRELIGVALPPHFAVRDHVDAGAFHVLHREPRRIVLRLFEVRLGHTPELARAHARREPSTEAVAIDQPGRLRIAPDDCRDDGSGALHALSV